MTPTHHPYPDDLAAYASGAAPEWMSVVVACHMTYCKECRDEVALLDELGGVFLDSLAAPGGAPLVTPKEPPRTEQAREPRIVSDSPLARGLPRPLHPYFKELSPTWRFLAPGLKHIPISLTVGEIPARLIQFKPGLVIPDHRHLGNEAVLVLDGILEDTVTKEVFHTGDLSRRDEESARHGNVVTSADPCVCLVVTDGPIDPATMWGRLLKALTGL
ncbi:MAG TPA: cupin domain-containing protein [Polyangiaceae bacterium]|jgi:putative transcriptional regulator|nr:cupin domain-containing protein [Polyangiaceae bacterium]